MNRARLSTILRYLLAAVWLLNGLFCKLLHLVPRHEAIVARILGPAYAAPLTRLIGIAEIIMAAWVLSRYRPRLNAAAQIALVGSMNLLEFWLAPDLLLWGRFNSLFALLLMGVVYIYGFRLAPAPTLSA